MEEEIHTVKDAPESLKHVLSSAESFHEAMQDPLRKGALQAWIEKEKVHERETLAMEIQMREQAKEIEKQESHQEQ